MSDQDRKKVVDDLFSHIEQDVKQPPVEREPRTFKLRRSDPSDSEQAREPKRGHLTSTRDLLNNLVDDYDKKLGTNLNLREREKPTFSSLIGNPVGLAFVGHSLMTAAHYTNHTGTVARQVGMDPDELRKQVIMPSLMVCAALATKIHLLEELPPVSIEGFDEVRIPDEPEARQEMVNFASEAASDNKRRWIALLCHDICMLVMNAIESIIDGKSANPIAMLLIKLTTPALMMGIGKTFMKDMVKASIDLERL